MGSDQDLDPPPAAGAGLVIGERSARLVVAHGDQLFAQEVDIPIGAVRCGRVMNQGALADALAPLASHARSLPTWIGIQPDDAVLQSFDLTGLTDAEQEAGLAELVSPFAEFGYVGGWVIEPSLGGTRALVIAVPAVHVHGAVHAARQAGFAVAGVELSAVSLVRSTGAAESTVTVADLGGARIVVATWAGAPVLAGWLGPVTHDRHVLAGRYYCHPRHLDLLVSVRTGALSSNRPGWPVETGFITGVASSLESLARSLVREPIEETRWGDSETLRIDPIGKALAELAVGERSPSVDLLAAANAVALPDPNDGPSPAGSSDACAAGIYGWSEPGVHPAKVESAQVGPAEAGPGGDPVPQRLSGAVPSVAEQTSPTVIELRDNVGDLDDRNRYGQTERQMSWMSPVPMAELASALASVGASGATMGGEATTVDQSGPEDAGDGVAFWTQRIALEAVEAGHPAPTPFADNPPPWHREVVLRRAVRKRSTIGLPRLSVPPRPSTVAAGKKREPRKSLRLLVGACLVALISAVAYFGLGRSTGAVGSELAPTTSIIPVAAISGEAEVTE